MPPSTVYLYKEEYGAVPLINWLKDLSKKDCWDNAPMESFFHTLKVELIHHRNYQTREEAIKSIMNP